MSKDKKKHNHLGHAFFKEFRMGWKLTSTTIGQNGQHIGHHCDCNDQQLDSDLLHGITSFQMDSL